MVEGLEIREAEPGDARTSRKFTWQRGATPCPTCIGRTLTETRDYFGRVVGDRPSACWVARVEDQVVGFMLIDGKDMDHRYVRRGWQPCGIGLSLLNKAKALSPQRLELWAFQRNTNARQNQWQSLYEAPHFCAVAYTDGRNQENEPDVKYAWETAR